MARGSPDYQPWNAVQRFSGTGGATPFEQKIDVPAATLVGAPVSQIITLIKGWVSKVSIKFPSGSAGLMHLSIWNGAVKLWPGNAAQYFTGDNETVDFSTEYDVPFIGGVYKLTIQGWNDDDSYQHSGLIRVWVVALP
jgi:hypothetical protein